MKEPCAQSLPAAFPSLDILRSARFAAFCVAILGATFSVSLCAIGIILYALLLAPSIARQRGSLPAAPHLFFLALLSISTVVSAVVSIYPDESFRGFLKFTQGIILWYAGLELIRDRNDLDRFVKFFMTCELLAASSALWQEFMGTDFINHRPPMIYTGEITRLTGPFNHCNDFATFLLPGLVLALVCCVNAWDGKRVRKGMLWIVVILFLSYVMMRTMSRGAFLGLLGSFVILAVGSRWRFRILTGIAAVMGLILTVPSSFRTRLLELFSPQGSGLQERWYLLKGTWKMVEAKPWFGMGLNTYSRWFPVFNPSDAPHPVLMYAHNSYAQIAAETGLIGLSLIVIFWFLGIGSGVRALSGSEGADRWVRAGVLAAVVGILINACFDSLIQSTQLRTLFWVFFGVLAAVSRRDGRWDRRST